jgi:hypothetical protein
MQIRSAQKLAWQNKVAKGFTGTYPTAFSRRETPTLTNQVFKWVEELTTAVLVRDAIAN